MAHIRLQDVRVEFEATRPGDRSIRRQLFSLAAVGGVVRQGADRRARIEALRDICLEIGDGERIGLIGHNGSGKTTLLKVLAGVYHPEAGSVQTRGRVSAIFDPGLGMYPDATGFENILLRGLILGMSRPQIEARMEDIAVFSGLGQYLEMPVRTYSTGMLLRLAFAVSTSIDPEILLLDEWIGAGDMQFEEQAQIRLRNLVDQSNILVLASHKVRLLESICTKAVLLEHGEVKAFGPVAEIVAIYTGKPPAAPVKA
jgi:ABC-2 type transport system ATP-binding protein/lipopolysaccharide transport system ATP-binding protein